MILSWKRQIPF